MEKQRYKTNLRKSFYVVAGLVGLAAIIVQACRHNDNYRADHGVPPCEITAPLDSLFGGMFDAGAPGAIITVMRGDTIVYNHAFGLARLDSAERITDSTLFNLASASKLFSAVALLKLCEDGKISLDDSLSKYFPEFAGDFFNDINIRHILTHSSGLPDLRPVGHDAWAKYSDNHYTVFGTGKDYRLYGTENEHMQTFQRLDTIAFVPGTHYQRNDPAYILVAPLIERVTGEKFDDWMSENIFKPAGLKETFYYAPGERRPRLAHGYALATPHTKSSGSFISEDGRWTEFDYGEADYFLTKADRGACSSAREVMQFKRALYSGKLIDTASLRDMKRPYVVTDVPHVCFGLGTALRLDEGMPVKSYHMNNNGGFSAIEGSWPDCGLHYVVLSSRNDWDQREVMAAIDSVLIAKGWVNKD